MTKTNSGQFQRKRGDTLIKNVEKTYKVDFKVRGDTKLSTYLKKEGLPSLSKALEKVSGNYSATKKHVKR